MNYFYYFFIFATVATALVMISQLSVPVVESPAVYSGSEPAVELPTIIVEQEPTGPDKVAGPEPVLPPPAVKASAGQQSKPTKVVLEAPFTSQAPEGDWLYPWQDTCEEASILMAAYYWQNKDLTLTSAKNELLAMVEYENSNFGSYHDTDAMMTKQLGEDFYNLKIDLLSEPTIEQMKSFLAAGYLIIAPLAGRLLSNPYFTPPGPSYHMLLIRGYDDESQEFITNDPGTKRGAGWRYSYATILNALHDWQGADETIEEGGRRILIIKGLDNEN